MPSPNGGRPSASHRAFTSAWAACMACGGRDRPVGVVGLGERGAEHGHHRVADELHHGALLAEDGAVHRRSVLVELAGELVGGVCSAMVE